MATAENRRAAILLLLLAAAGLVVRFWQVPGPAPGAVAYSAPGPRPAGDSVAARAVRLARPLGEGERIDVDRASAEELARLPRVGPGLAVRIVADRDAHGPFGSLEGLDRVSGVGPTLLAAIRAHAVFSAAGLVPADTGRSHPPSAGSPLIDHGAFATLDPSAPSAGGSGEELVRLNTASEAELQQLPGIGTALARAIVAERSAHGPFQTLEDLRRVHGLKPSVLRGLTGRIIVP